MPSSRILIVEDERQTVDSLRDFFELYGYETEVALSKQVALAILQERKMDIAIISAIVQDSTGIEIINEAKKINVNLPVIIISTQKSKRLEASFIKAGADIFLQKPLDNISILQTIKNILKTLIVTTTPPRKRPKTYLKSKR